MAVAGITVKTEDVKSLDLRDACDVLSQSCFISCTGWLFSKIPVFCITSILIRGDRIPCFAEMAESS